MKIKEIERRKAKMETQVKARAVAMPANSARYMVVDIETNRVLDDARGYGYRSKAKAYAAYSFKHPTKKQTQNRRYNHAFLREHPDFLDEWNNYIFSCIKDMHQPRYDDFHKMVLELEPDYKGDIKSLYYYVQRR